ncbi:hypothetical protein FHS06_001521 [Microbacterium halimionae]|nr:hypothetical protein [Microbacterium halimionae]
MLDIRRVVEYLFDIGIVSCTGDVRKMSFTF